MKIVAAGFPHRRHRRTADSGGSGIPRWHRLVLVPPATRVMRSRRGRPPCQEKSTAGSRAGRRGRLGCRRVARRRGQGGRGGVGGGREGGVAASSPRAAAGGGGCGGGSRVRGGVGRIFTR